MEPLPEFPLDTPVPKDFGAALREMANKPFLATQKWQEQQWRANRVGAHPDILEFEKVFIKRMGKLGVPMFTHCMVRSFVQQQKEFDEGDSKARPGQSAHNFGMAVDIVHSVRAWQLSDLEWKLVGHVGHELVRQKGLALVNMTWGGPDGVTDRFRWDPAHWEIADWRTHMEDYPWLT